MISIRKVDVGFTLIRHGFAVPPSPVKGEGLGAEIEVSLYQSGLRPPVVCIAALCRSGAE